ncbi:unnamed protein product [Cuscuta epithymum]|uniref:Serpin domain-containing protein n=1 Tax=Cuscuta epithymum TaxID=186058 RepID=A0AAV0ENX1_9ASTE|nr:unnamed protein product [Cuscuta epithymum]
MSKFGIGAYLLSIFLIHSLNPYPVITAFHDSITNRTEEVSLMLAKHVISAAIERGENVALSPLSITTLLGMIGGGSQGGAPDQLSGFLDPVSTNNVIKKSGAFDFVTSIFSDGSRSSGGSALTGGNGVWIDKSLTLKPAYKDHIESSYNALIQSVDFREKVSEVIDEVNAWVEKKTGGLIRQLLDERTVTPQTIVVLANALHFKGAWANEFDVANTMDRDFYLMDGASVQVPFMSSSEKQYLKAFDGFKVLRMPYRLGENQERQQFSMYFILPDTEDGLPSLVDKLTSESTFLEQHIPYNKVKVGEFRIPKFKISFDLDILDVLEKLGVTNARHALSGMVENPISTPIDPKFFHKSVVEVNEEGTEAAAVTMGIFSGSSLVVPVEEKIDFVADHPFLFFIREDLTRTLVFAGSVLNPGL